MPKYLIHPDGHRVVIASTAGARYLLGEDDDDCCCPVVAGACAVCAEIGLSGSYENASEISGLPVLERVDATINIDNDAGSPGPGVNADNYVVRWTGWINANVTGTHTIYATSVSGVRVTINGVLLINQWTDHSLTTDTATVSLTAGTPGTIQVDYRHRTGNATMKLEWSYTGQSQTIIPERSFSTGSQNTISAGLTSTYYPSLDLSGTGSLGSTSSTINFSFAGSPAAGIPTDNWSARFEGFLLGPLQVSVNPPPTTAVTFYLTHKDGARLWVDDTLLIDNWTDQATATTDTSAPITLHYAWYKTIRIEQYKKTGTSNIKLEWSYTGQAQAIVPLANLARGTSRESPAQHTVTVSGATMCPFGVSTTSGGHTYVTTGGDVNGTYCISPYTSAGNTSLCREGVVENPGTTVTVTDNGVGDVYVVQLGRSFGSASIQISSSDHQYFNATVASFDCTESLTFTNSFGSCTTGSGAHRATGGTAVVTPAAC